MKTMSLNGASRTIAFFSLTLFISITVWASEGRYPIYEPTTITSPGKYIVTRNITAAGIIINVQSSNVDIDLNGFTLESTAPTDPVINVQGVSHVAIRNGIVSYGQNSIHVQGTIQVVIEDIASYYANGAAILMVDSSGDVRRCHIFSPYGEGIYFENYGAPGVFEDNVIEGTQSTGIRVVYGRGAVISGNRLISVSGNAIHLSGSTACLISRNSIDDAYADVIIRGIFVENSMGITITGNCFYKMGSGIYLVSSTGCQLSENTLSWADIEISNSSGTQVFNNVIEGGWGNGIFLNANANHNRILNNVVSNRQGDGMIIGGKWNYIEGNLLNGNAYFGLNFTSFAQDNVYRGNMAHSNAGGGTCTNKVSNDLCDDGSGDVSHGDNYMPGKL